MAKREFLTTQIKTTGMPPGIPYIVGNEAAERFSYYGMNSILVTFMTKYMMDASGAADRMTPAQANEWYHTFATVLYFVPVLGAILSDAFLGKFRTIFYLSIIYCFGHLALALNQTRAGLVVGLALIAIGAGGIKPCVSANVGDQFGTANASLLPRAFSWFYFAINFGSMFSTILIPYLLEQFCRDIGIPTRWGPHIAFGTPGLLMILATIVIWVGRYKYVHVPPGGVNFLREAISVDGRRALGRLAILVPFIAMFWALWQQNFSAWVIQAEQMNRQWLGREWQAGQIQTVNAISILVFLPLFSYWLYPTIDRVFKLTPLRKIGLGLFLTVVAFLIPAWIETRLAAGLKPHIGWQVLAFLLISAAEVTVSVTHLEFSYTQAPPRLKSLVMSLYLAAIALGNFFTAQVNRFIQNPDGTARLTGANYYLFFAAVMLVTAVLWVVMAANYRGKTYVQEDAKTEGT